MPEHIQYQDDELFNPETHHEESDVPIKPLFWAIFIFIVFAVVTHLVLAAMYNGFVKSERKRMDPPQTQVARPSSADVPQNQPLLQPFPRSKVLLPNQDTPVTDLSEMRAREERALKTYGWVDQEHGVVRVPIEVAKEKFVQSGTPASPPADQAASPPPGGTP